MNDGGKIPYANVDVVQGCIFLVIHNNLINII
jgi:hypothetical protein